MIGNHEELGAEQLWFVTFQSLHHCQQLSILDRIRPFSSCHRLREVSDWLPLFVFWLLLPDDSASGVPRSISLDLRWTAWDKESKDGCLDRELLQSLESLTLFWAQRKRDVFLEESGQGLGELTRVMAENSDVVAEAEERSECGLVCKVFELPAGDGLDLLRVNPHAFADFQDHAEVVNRGNSEPRLVDVALQVSSVQSVDNLFDLVPMGLFVVLVSVNQYIIGVCTSEQVQEFVELRVDEGLPPSWAHFQTKGQHIPSKRPLTGLEGRQVLGPFLDAEAVKRLDDVDFGHALSVPTVRDCAVHIWRQDLAVGDELVDPPVVDAEASLRRMRFWGKQDRGRVVVHAGFDEANSQQLVYCLFFQGHERQRRPERGWRSFEWPGQFKGHVMAGSTGWQSC